MKKYGERGPKQVYFNAMGKKARNLSANSMKFLEMADRMRNDIDAIPEDPSDKNHVDKWFRQQQEKFKMEHSSTFEKLIKNPLKGKQNFLSFYAHK